MRELPDWFIVTILLAFAIAATLTVSRWLGLPRSVAVYVAFAGGTVASLAWFGLQWSNNRAWQRSIDESKRQNDETTGD